MQVLKVAALLLGKSIFKITRILKLGGGSAAPGLYALKLYPNLVLDLIKNIPQNIVITGTNGKTTTARMLAHFAQAHGLKVLRNQTGSNLERGIASTLISSSHLTSGKAKSVDLAIWELDEAAFNQVAPKLNPHTIIFLNVFRDQLDRYGEVDSIVKKWCQTLGKLPNSTKLLINADDANLQTLKESFKGKIQTFGVEGIKIRGEKVAGNSKTNKIDFEAKSIKNSGLTGSKFFITSSKEKTTVNLPLPGVYHIYDFLAAFACAHELGINDKESIDSLKDFSPAFGRVEKFKLQPRGLQSRDGYIFLIKNPTGATEVFQTIKGELKSDDRLLLALNDNLADGTDVSWIWDGKFEELRVKNSECRIICSGTRAQDLAVRLKYAGFDPKLIEVENSLENAFKRAGEDLKGKMIILPTYTALLSLQNILVKNHIKTHYWEEN